MGVIEYREARFNPYLSVVLDGFRDGQGILRDDELFLERSSMFALDSHS